MSKTYNSVNPSIWFSSGGISPLTFLPDSVLLNQSKMSNCQGKTNTFSTMIWGSISVPFCIIVLYLFFQLWSVKDLIGYVIWLNASTCIISNFSYISDITHIFVILGGIVVLQVTHSHWVPTQGSPSSSVQSLPNDMERKALRVVTSKLQL